MGALESIRNGSNRWRNMAVVLGGVLIVIVLFFSWQQKTEHRDALDTQLLVLDAIQETTHAVEGSERRLSDQLTVTGERLDLRHDELAATIKELREWVRDYGKSRRAARMAVNNGNGKK